MESTEGSNSRHGATNCSRSSAQPNQITTWDQFIGLQRCCMVTSTGAQYGSLESMDFVILIHPQLGDPGTPLRRQLSSFSGKSDVLNTKLTLGWQLKGLTGSTHTTCNQAAMLPVLKDVHEAKCCNSMYFCQSNQPF